MLCEMIKLTDENGLSFERLLDFLSEIRCTNFDINLIF